MDLNKSPYAIYDDMTGVLKKFDAYSAADLLLKTASSKDCSRPQF
jgi:hypothetical protein